MNIQFHEAVQLIYANALRHVEEAFRSDDAGEPYRLLTYALEAVYTESFKGIAVRTTRAIDAALLNDKSTTVHRALRNHPGQFGNVPVTPTRLLS